MRNNLSAGRVQSVAVRLIAEREREINAFTAVSTFKVEAIFTAKDLIRKTVTFKAEGNKHSSMQKMQKNFWKAASALIIRLPIYR